MSKTHYLTIKRGTVKMAPRSKQAKFLFANKLSLSSVHVGDGKKTIKRYNVK